MCAESKYVSDGSLHLINMIAAVAEAPDLAAIFPVFTFFIPMLCRFLLQIANFQHNLLAVKK